MRLSKKHFNPRAYLKKIKRLADGYVVAREEHATKQKIEKNLRLIEGVSLADLPHADFSLQMLTCHADTLSSLWALLSFCHFAEVQPQIIVHDDGSLTPSDLQALKSAIRELRVVSTREGEALGNERLKDFPRLRKLHSELPHPMLRKLTQPWLVQSCGYSVLMDSDVLHFNRPTEVLENVESGTAFFNGDYQNAHYVAMEDLESFLGKPILENFNAGYIGLSHSQHSFELIEQFPARFPEGSSTIHRIEQSAHACLLTRACAQRLPAHYALGRSATCESDVARHFVNDGSRPLFALAGIPKLRERGFPEAFSGTG